MQKTKKRLSALSLAVCLIAAVAFGGVAAWAVGTWWTPGGNSLTVTAANSNDEAFLEDIAKADVVADVIKIADATANDSYQAFDYTLVKGFESLSEEFAAATGSKSSSAENWQRLADAAAKLVTLTEPGTMTLTDAATGSITSTLSGLEDGLYLVIAHGTGITEPDGGKYVASSTYYDYIFPPTIVALPGKDEVNPDGEHAGYPSTDYGNWVKEVAIEMKAERVPAMGSLKIVKNVTDFSGDPATFVFHIVGTQLDGTPYENYASVYYPEKPETVVEGIPAGTVVTVTEEYEGGRYEFESMTPADGKVTIVSDRRAAIDLNLEQASVTVVNKPNGHDVPGHGIENNFTAAEDGNWTWHSTPVQDSEKSSQKKG